MCEVIDLGNGRTAMICNCKKTDHVCNDDLNVIILANGDTHDNTKENSEKYHNEVVGGSVGCSVCGRLAIQDAPYF